MQLPTVFKPTSSSLPPMHAWPRFVKRSVLVLAVLSVLAAYALLAGGLIAVIAILAERMS